MTKRHNGGAVTIHGLQCTMGLRVRAEDLGEGTVVDTVKTFDGPKAWVNFDAHGEYIFSESGLQRLPTKTERLVAKAEQKMRATAIAAANLAAEREPSQPAFDAGSLTELLARPPEPAMRVDGLVPADSGTLLVAQRKTGKTTVMLNLCRSLLTGEDLFGRFPVQPVSGNVAILNFEVSAAMIARWADEVRVPEDRLFIVNTRGRRNPLGHRRDRERLAGWLRERDIESLLVDPFGRAFTGSSQNDAGEVGAWLVDLDLFARSEVGARDVLLTAHAGWNGERSRGSTALEDWADSIIYLARDKTDERVRYLRAEGRDVDVDEDRLDFNPVTRHVSLSGAGSRRQASESDRIAYLSVRVVRAARDHPGAGVSEIESYVKAMDDAPDRIRNGDVSKAAKFAQQQGFLRIESHGPGRKSRHFALTVNPSPLIPDPSPG